MEIKIFVLIDSEELWEQGGSEEDAAENFAETHGPCTHPTRMLIIHLEVPSPDTVVLSAIIPADAIPPIPVKMTVK